MGDSGNASDYGSRVKIGAQATLAGVSGFEAGFGGADASSPSDLASSLDELLNSRRRLLLEVINSIMMVKGVFQFCIDQYLITVQWNYGWTKTNTIYRNDSTL
jgi:hypothetical protein